MGIYFDDGVNGAAYGKKAVMIASHFAHHVSKV